MRQSNTLSKTQWHDWICTIKDSSSLLQGYNFTTTYTIMGWQHTLAFFVFNLNFTWKLTCSRLLGVLIKNNNYTNVVPSNRLCLTASKTNAQFKTRLTSLCVLSLTRTFLTRLSCNPHFPKKRGGIHNVIIVIPVFIWQLFNITNKKISSNSPLPRIYIFIDYTL